jgi:hypothetical protein
MRQESIVYGCIKDQFFATRPDEAHRRREVNRQVLSMLPSVEEWPLLGREMFALPAPVATLDAMHTDVVPFGSSYVGVEYEWEQWIRSFEQLLQRMYWVSATVHLETEYSGVHTFTWESASGSHEPGGGPLSMRCEWTRESPFA